jgi:hypothetical protein
VSFGCCSVESGPRRVLDSKTIRSLLLQSKAFRRGATLSRAGDRRGRRNVSVGAMPNVDVSVGNHVGDPCRGDGVRHFRQCGHGRGTEGPWARKIMPQNAAALITIGHRRMDRPFPCTTTLPSGRLFLCSSSRKVEHIKPMTTRMDRQYCPHSVTSRPYSTE